MIEAAPVHAAVATAPSTVNFTSGSAMLATNDTSSVSGGDGVDPRRYSKFDRTASAVGSASMSFGDVLDMVNPLQHIPVVSSVYREIMGDKINPVSRVAGDILYGGVMGVAAAVAGGIGGVADNVMESQTGKDVEGSVFAALFDNEKAVAGGGDTQIAAADPAQSSPPVAQDAVPDKSAPIAQQPLLADTSATSPGGDKPEARLAEGSALPLNKLPFGGALAPGKSMQQQNMAMALASAGANGVRIGNTVYANRFLNGPHLAPAVGPSASAGASATTAAATDAQPALISALPSAGAASSITQSVTGSRDIAALPSTPVPAALADDAAIMRALSMYQSVATGGGAGRASAGVNVLN